MEFPQHTRRTRRFQQSDAPLESVLRGETARNQDTRLIGPQTKEARLKLKRRRRREKQNSLRETEHVAEERAQLDAFDTARAKSRHAKKRQVAASTSLPSLYDSDSSSDDEFPPRSKTGRLVASVSLPRL